MTLKTLEKDLPKDSFWVFWHQIAASVIFTEWQMQNYPETVTIPLAELKFLTDMEKAAENGIVKLPYVEIECPKAGISFFNGLFEIHCDGTRFLAKYRPVTKVTAADTLMLQAEVPVCMNHAVLGKGAYQFRFPLNLTNLYSIRGDYLLHPYEGEKMLYVRASSGGGFFPYSKETIEEVLRWNEEEFKIYAVYQQQGCCKIREIISVFNDTLCSCQVTNREYSWFPADMQKEIRETELQKEEYEDSALQYIQQMLDMNLDVIKAYANGKKCRKWQNFHGYCMEVCHRSICRPDGDIPLDWHNIPPQEIPAAWMMLQKFVMCSSYPLSMWSDTE